MTQVMRKVRLIWRFWEVDLVGKWGYAGEFNGNATMHKSLKKHCFLNVFCDNGVVAWLWKWHGQGQLQCQGQNAVAAFGNQRNPAQPSGTQRESTATWIKAGWKVM